MANFWERSVKAMPHWTVIAFAALVAMLSWFLLPDGGWDWRYAYAPAARTWWAPWTQGLPLVPWAAVALVPLAAMPDRLATTLVNGSSVIAISLVARRLGGKDWYAVPVMLTPFGYWMMRNGQVDGLILAALLLSYGFDALILITKPQVAAGAIVATRHLAPPCHLLGGPLCRIADLFHRLAGLAIQDCSRRCQPGKYVMELGDLALGLADRCLVLISGLAYRPGHLGCFGNTVSLPLRQCAFVADGGGYGCHPLAKAFSRFVACNGRGIWLVRRFFLGTSMGCVGLWSCLSAGLDRSRCPSNANAQGTI
jgi:hypothetical protein